MQDTAAALQPQPTEYVEMHRDSLENADTVDAVPDSKKTRHVAGLQACAVNTIGSTFPKRSAL